MQSDRDLLRQALGYMESVGQMDMHPEEWAIAVALRERLAQPEQWEQFYPDMGKPQPNTIANSEAIPEQISEPVAWRDHVEQRLLTWRQSFVNRSGDQLALDDFMDKESLDDLIDYVCDEYTTPPRREWVGLTLDDMEELAVSKEWLAGTRWAEAKLKEKNDA